jgi:hypothetical protein
MLPIAAAREREPLEFPLWRGIFTPSFFGDPRPFEICPSIAVKKIQKQPLHCRRSR